MGRGKRLNDLPDGNPFAKRFCMLMDTAEPRLSQEQLGKIIGVSKSAIAFYRDGRSQPDYSNLIKIAKYYNVTTDYLLGLTESKSYDSDIRIACDYTCLPEYSIRDIRQLLHNSFEDPLTLQKRRSGLSAMLESPFAPDLLDAPRKIVELVGNASLSVEEITKDAEKADDLGDLLALKNELDALIQTIEFSVYRSGEVWKSFLKASIGLEEFTAECEELIDALSKRIADVSARHQEK